MTDTEAIDTIYGLFVKLDGIDEQGLVGGLDIIETFMEALCKVLDEVRPEGRAGS